MQNMEKIFLALPCRCITNLYIFKLFEDQKDSIKLTSLVSNVVDQETQQKIDVVKGRLIRDYGYDDESATDVLNFVASIFARGDVREEE